MLAEIGYSIRAAEERFSALIEIQKNTPDTILPDLNMPGISGFEFLSVVRRRFPSIPVIAMSGAFSGDEVPSGVAADAFYQKGSGVSSLLKIIEGLASPERMPANNAHTKAPLLIQRNGRDASGEPCVTIPCPECLRSFSQLVGGSLSVVREANCAYCRNPIYYTIVELVDWVPRLGLGEIRAPELKARILTKKRVVPAGLFQVLESGEMASNQASEISHFLRTGAGTPLGVSGRKTEKTAPVEGGSALLFT